MSESEPLSQEAFQRIYSDDCFLRKVATAHVCCDNSGTFRHFETCDFPARNIVSEEQIQEAKTLFEQRKKEVLHRHKNDLLFICMGCDYADRYNDDIGNYRIRTEFLNSKGRRFFVEFIAMGSENMHVEYAVDRDAEIRLDNELKALHEQANGLPLKSEERRILMHKITELRMSSNEKHNGLAYSKLSEKYTKKNVLILINKHFDCNFSSIVIDKHILAFSDAEILCISPGTATMQPASQLKLF